MPANLVKNKADEQLWSKARAQAVKQGKDENWAYINSIFQSMKGSKKTAGLGQLMKFAQLIVEASAAGKKMDKDIASQGVNMDPSEKQKESGTYKKAKIRLHGLEISIENPKGGYRSGVSDDGKVWKNKMKCHYGYFNRTTGHDGDHVDTFIGEDPESDKVFIVNQRFNGKFDEHKVMLGFTGKDQASKGYLANYDKGWEGLGSIVECSVSEFKTWLKDGNMHKEFRKGASMNKLLTKSSSRTANWISAVGAIASTVYAAAYLKDRKKRQDWENRMEESMAAQGSPGEVFIPDANPLIFPESDTSLRTASKGTRMNKLSVKLAGFEYGVGNMASASPGPKGDQVRAGLQSPLWNFIRGFTPSGDPMDHMMTYRNPRAGLVEFVNGRVGHTVPRTPNVSTNPLAAAPVSKLVAAAPGGEKTGSLLVKFAQKIKNQK